MPDTLPEPPQLTDAEWRALPAAEKSRLRAEKRARRAAERAAESSPPVGPPRQPDPDKTPFLTLDGRPMFLKNGPGSCFIILSGPSLDSLDLSKLRRRGAFTLAVNNAGTVFRPNAWTFVDPPEKFHNAIWLDPAVQKFVPSKYLRWKIRERAPDGSLRYFKLNNGSFATAADMPNVVQVVRNALLRPDHWLSEPTINWGNSKRSAKKNRLPRDLNVFLASLKIAWALGFQTIYLLGCDFRMDESRPYAFAEHKHAAGVGCNNNKYQTIIQFMTLLKPHFDAAGFRVFNCNPRSGLTVFDFVSYDQAIEAATGHVPQEPLDTLGWYVK